MYESDQAKHVKVSQCGFSVASAEQVTWLVSEAAQRGGGLSQQTLA